MFRWMGGRGRDRAHAFVHAPAGVSLLALYLERPVELRGNPLLVEIARIRAHRRALRWKWFTLFTCSRYDFANTWDPSLRETK
jgi:hypothetical protein